MRLAVSIHSTFNRHVFLAMDITCILFYRIGECQRSEAHTLYDHVQATS